MLGFNGGLLGVRRDQKRATSGLWLPNERAIIQATDPHWENVSLLLHMDGSNNSTTFTDSSINRNFNSVSVNGNAKISTAQSKFGGASALFDGSGDYLTVPSSSMTSFGIGNFTVEAWIRPSAPPGGGANNDACIFGSMTSSPNSIFFLTNGENRPAHWDGTSQRGGTTSLASNTWSHVAWSRGGGTLKIFVNGVEDFSGSMTTDLPTAIMYIGGTPSSSRFLNGYIDELRITKGVARYTANFTPPTAPFPDA